MLAGAVDAGIRFFMEQADQIVTEGYLLHSFHDELVVVRRDVRCRKNGRHFILRRRHFVMLRLGGDAHFPQFHIEIVHVGGNPVLNRAEILVLKLLALGGGGAENRSSRQHQIDPLRIELLVDEKIFLFRADRGGYYSSEVLLPNVLSMRKACLDSADIDLSRGVFLSSASPLYE